MVSRYGCHSNIICTIFIVFINYCCILVLVWVISIFENVFRGVMNNIELHSIATGAGLSKILRGTKIMGRQRVVMTDESIGVSQLC